MRTTLRVLRSFDKEAPSVAMTDMWLHLDASWMVSVRWIHQCYCKSNARRIACIHRREPERRCFCFIVTSRFKNL